MAKASKKPMNRTDRPVLPEKLQRALERRQAPQSAAFHRQNPRTAPQRQGPTRQKRG